MTDKTIVVHNDFERLAAELTIAAQEIVADTANEIEELMRSGTRSDRIESTIRTRWGAGRKTATITAGDKGKGFHAGFEEYGAAFNPGHSFATPSADIARPNFLSEMSDLEKRMR